MKIGDRSIGPGHPVAVVCEISCNHMGSLKRALKLIDAAKASGADFVKFQAYLPAEMCLLRGIGPAPAPWEGYSLPQLYEEAKTPFEWFPHLVKYCDDADMPWCSSVFGTQSFLMLRGLDCPAYKIARTDNRDVSLAAMAVSSQKPVFRSIGLYDDVDPWPEITDLYCPAGYPTPRGNVHLPQMGEGFRCLGLSSHCLDPELPIAAVARGAKILEYHLMLDGTKPLDYPYSLTPKQFRKMVESVRRTEELLA